MLPLQRALASSVLALVVIASSPLTSETEGGERPRPLTLETLSDMQKLSLIDLLPMKSSVDQAATLCPGLEERHRDDWEVGTVLFGWPATVLCGFRAGCLYQILFELRGLPAAAGDSLFRSAVMHYEPRYGKPDYQEVEDPEGTGVTASWCTADYGLYVSSGRGLDTTDFSLVYQFWCAENPQSIRHWKHEWTCDRPRK